jgi:hypothetical protein
VDDSSVGAAVSAFVAEELDAERTRKASLESRGLAVITSSGTLVTLLLGLAALVTKADKFKLADSERWLLAAAALLFVVAGAVGIVCNAPARYLQIEPASLTGMLAPEAWSSEGTSARRELTAAKLAELADARGRNEWKARLLAGAMAVQGAAVLMAAVAVVLVLRR